MDQPEIDQLIVSADRRAVFINQVGHAKERFRSRNTLVWEGHVFTLDQGFITYLCLSYMEWLTTDKDKRPRVIFLDKNEEPVQIEDLTEFITRAQECHNDALSDYYDTYSSLERAQSTEELIEIS